MNTNDRLIQERIALKRGNKIVPGGCDGPQGCGYNPTINEKPVIQVLSKQGEPIRVDCPECGGYVYRQNVILDRESKKAIRVAYREQTIEEQARDCFFETTKMDIDPGGGSSNGKSRKAPPKKFEVRWEQEPIIFNNGRCKSKIEIKQVEKAEKKVNLCIPLRYKKIWAEECAIRGGEKGWTFADLVRSAMDLEIMNLKEVPAMDYTDDTNWRFQIAMYEGESLRLDAAADAFGASKGAVVAECVERFMS